MLKMHNYIKEDNEIELVIAAFSCADKLHKGQKRQSGENYIQHPLNVAFILAEMNADANTLAAALLHDTIEDCNITKEEISQQFNAEIAMLVDGVSKIKGMNFATKDKMSAANQRKILTAINEDVRIIIIKLADRLHNMRTLWVKPEYKQKETALETIELYVPIAHYLGLHNIKNELANISFKYLKPDIYNDILNKLNKIEIESQNCINKMMTTISSLLDQNNINYEITFRIKNIYSVYKGLLAGKQITNIHDLLSIKIVVDDVKDCYMTLGLVHSKYWPINNKFKDYIVNPKTNMYQSLHTTVFGEDDYVIQLQIRGRKMDLISTNGITTYWKEEHHELDDTMQQQLKDKFQFFKSLVELYDRDCDDIEFINLVKDEILNYTIYVYTPKGEVIELPFGSTPIDLAYKLHTDIGNTMVGVIVNDEYVNFDTQLHNKDRVKIVTNSLAAGPSKEWIDMARTQSAKKKIREFLNKGNKSISNA
jgi:GTP pyrophosphokinase